MQTLMSFGQSDIAPPPASRSEALSVIKTTLNRLGLGTTPSVDLLVVAETGTKFGLEYDDTNKILKIPKNAYDNLFAAFQVLGAAPPWVTHTYPVYTASPLGKPDLVKRLRNSSQTRPIYFILSTSNAGLTPSKDVIGEIADFYSSQQFDTRSAGRPRWLVPVLVGAGLLAAGITTVALVRR
jgi:hypothetical protein